MAMAKPDAIFMHCLPSFHDTNTTIGREIADKFCINEMEVYGSWKTATRMGCVPETRWRRTT